MSRLRAFGSLLKFCGSFHENSNKKRPKCKKVRILPPSPKFQFNFNKLQVYNPPVGLPEALIRKTFGLRWSGSFHENSDKKSRKGPKMVLKKSRFCPKGLNFAVVASFRAKAQILYRSVCSMRQSRVEPGLRRSGLELKLNEVTTIDSTQVRLGQV